MIRCETGREEVIDDLARVFHERGLVVSRTEWLKRITTHGCSDKAILKILTLLARSISADQLAVISKLIADPDSTSITLIGFLTHSAFWRRKPNPCLP